MRKDKGLYIGFLIALIASVYFAIGARSKEPLFLDQVLSDFVTNVFHETSHPFFTMISELGDKIGIGIVALLMLLWLWLKKRDYFGMTVFVLAVAIGNEANKWIKELVGRERQVFDQVEVAESLSFPSGHAMVGFILYMLAAHLLAENVKSNGAKLGIGLFAFIIVLLIGLSRIVLQAHFPTDVLGGYTIGTAWTILWIIFYNWLYERFPKK
jgi:undecaprenyl-diphosphatase